MKTRKNIMDEITVEFGSIVNLRDYTELNERIATYIFNKYYKVSNPAEVLVMPKIAERAIAFLYEGLGTCPADNCDYTKIDCENLCDTEGRKVTGCPKCWMDYFADDSNFTA
jgi:hypothetical protein